MVKHQGESNGRETYLAPIRHSQEELFLCDVADVFFKDIAQHLEHPFFTLSKKPDTSVFKYEHNGVKIEIVPSIVGLPTIYDKDILIYAISQIMSRKRAGEPVTPTVRLVARDLLIFANRGVGGKDYEALKKAIGRLGGVRIEMTMPIGGDLQEMTNVGWIDRGSVVKQDRPDGRLEWVELTISQWVFDAIDRMDVLTLHRDYFRLRKPIERRLYELARKHCGRQPEWRATVALLHKKSGSKSSIREFRRSMRHLLEHNYLPDYTVEYEKPSDQVIFRNRTKWWRGESARGYSPSVTDETITAAKELLQPGVNVEDVFRQWCEWWRESGEDHITDPDAAFLGFCKIKARQIQERHFSDSDRSWAEPGSAQAEVDDSVIATVDDSDVRRQ